MEMNKLKKINLCGEIGALIGVIIGAVLSLKGKSGLYVGLGAMIGSILGYLLGIFFSKFIHLNSIDRLYRAMDSIFMVASACIALLAVGAFVLTKSWIAIMGAIFFGFGALFLNKTKGEHWSQYLPTPGAVIMDKNKNILYVIGCFVMAATGIVVYFFLDGGLIALLSAILFGFGGLFLLFLLFEKNK